MKIPNLTHEQVLYALSYDKLTGFFRWNHSLGRRVKAGDLTGSMKPCGHLTIQINKQPILAGALAIFFVTKSWPKEFVDHRNRVPFDNRWVNLRECSRLQNAQNRHFQGIDFPGVNINQTGIISANLVVDKRKLYLGTFKTKEEAHQAYRKASLEHFGEFSQYYLHNIPEHPEPKVMAEYSERFDLIAKLPRFKIKG